MAEKIAVLGAGSWGSVLANLLDENGNDVRLWSNNPDQVAELNEKHTNEHYVHDFKYSESLKAYTDLTAALDGVAAILFVVPTGAIRIVAQQVKAVLQSTDNQPIIIHASKGLELNTHKRLSEVLSEEIPADSRQAVVVLSRLATSSA